MKALPRGASRLLGPLLMLALLLASSGCSLLKPKPKVAMPPPGVASDLRVTPLLASPTTTAQTGAPAATPEQILSTVVPGEGVGDRAPYRLRQNDPIIIFLRGIMPKDDQIEEIVDERGYITLPYIDDVLAAGRTSSELEREIQRLYIEREIYRSITVNVVMPSQSYFVQGEVRQPQRYNLVTGTTLLQAIASAGGYTDFADPKRVTLTRGRDVKVVNMREVERDPRQDISVESGDVIRVPRSIF